MPVWPVCFPVQRLVITSACAWFLFSVSQVSADDLASAAKVPDAVAASEAEMKPYSEPLKYTDTVIEMVPIKVASS